MVYQITSKFQATESFRSHTHNGLDLAMPKGTPLKSIKEGVIEKIVDYGDVNAGKTIFVKWDDGKTAIYGHLDRFSRTIHEGDKVSTGQIIGYSGNSGHVVGANGGYHLHFGLKDANGQFIDPEPYAPLLQNMDKLTADNNISKMSDNYESFTKLDHNELFQQTMENFGGMLQDMKINLISHIIQLLHISQEYVIIYINHLF